MKRFVLGLSVVVLLLLFATALFADQKVKKRMTVGQQSFDSTSYLKGQRTRDEMNFGQFQLTTINQCDAHQTITVNDRTKTYMIVKENETTAPAKPATTAKGAPQKQEQVIEEEPEPVEGARKGGTITFTTSVQDTGEKKEFFGYPARHVKTTMTSQSSADACDPNQSFKMTSDGWYIDFKETTQICQKRDNPMSMSEGPTPSPRRERPSCQDKIRYTGPGIMAFGKLGYPVDVTTTVVGKDGKENSFRQQALEISKATLDPALFEPPAGYKQAKNMAELYGFTAGGILKGALSGAAHGNAGAPSAARSAAATPEVGPKAPGKIRVGVVAFEDKSGKVSDADALRKSLIEDIERFGYEAVPVDSQSQDAAMADAKAKDCDFVVFNSLNTQAGGGGMVSKKKLGGFLKGAATGGLAGGVIGGATSGNGPGPFQGTDEYKMFKIGASDASLTNSAEVKGEGAGSSAMDKESRDIAKQIQKEKH